MDIDTCRMQAQRTISGFAHSNNLSVLIRQILAIKCWLFTGLQGYLLLLEWELRMFWECYVFVFNENTHILWRVDFRPYNESALLLFQGSDGNHDGIFSRQELDDEFVKYDTNGLTIFHEILFLSIYNKYLHVLQFHIL